MKLKSMLKDKAEQGQEALQRVDQLEQIVNNLTEGGASEVSKYKYSETERQINSVLKHQDEDLDSLSVFV